MLDCRKTLLIVLMPLFCLCRPGFANGIDWQAGFAEATGYGTAPPQATSAAHGALLAESAAKADAYRHLLELVSGIRLQVTAGDLRLNVTMEDLMRQNGDFKATLSGYVQGAKVVETRRLYDGAVRVTVRAPLQGVGSLQSVLPLPPTAENWNSKTALRVLEQPGAEAPVTAGEDILLTLNWRHGSVEGKDLGLGCFYQQTDGGQGMLEDDGKQHGAAQNPPNIQIAAGNYGGKAFAGESLRISRQKLASFQRILLYAYSYGQDTAWAELDGALTLEQGNRPRVLLRLDEPDTAGEIYAIGVLEKTPDGAYRLYRLGDCFDSRADMAKAYGWEFDAKEVLVK
jgi:uncharacterized protein involved in tellurium resistance